MSNVKVIWYETVCTYPTWGSHNCRDGSYECYDCAYSELKKHIVCGTYKRIDYDEKAGTFSFCNKKIKIDDTNPDTPAWIEYLEIDGEKIIDIRSGENE